MGGRLLRRWIEQPLVSFDAIQARLNAVSVLSGKNVEKLPEADYIIPPEQHKNDFMEISKSCSDRC